MSDTNAWVLRSGHRIALDQDVYTVIQLNGTTVTLQDQHAELSAMLLGYLLTAPGFAAKVDCRTGPLTRRREFSGLA
jgi:hypothetical protein